MTSKRSSTPMQLFRARARGIKCRYAHLNKHKAQWKFPDTFRNSIKEVTELGRALLVSDNEISKITGVAVNTLKAFAGRRTTPSQFKRDRRTVVTVKAKYRPDVDPDQPSKANTSTP